MGLSATHTTTLCHSWSGQHSSAITEIMRGFKCKTTGQDVFTDSFKIELLHDLMYKVHGSYKTEDYTISDALIGGNKSEEAGEKMKQRVTLRLLLILQRHQNLLKPTILYLLKKKRR